MKRFKELVTNQKFIFWFITLALIVTNVMMFFTESTSTFTRLIQIILPFSLYWFIMTLAKKPGKAFWWLFIVAFYDAFEIVLLKLYGETPLAVDMLLNVTTTNVTEVNELLSNLLPAVIFAVTTYMICIVLSIVSIRKKTELDSTYRRRQRKRAAISLALSVALLITNYFASPAFKLRNDIFPFNAAYNTCLAVQRVVKTSGYHNSSSDFTYRATSTVPDTVPQITVLIIGETARADNWGIYGYERNTTPRLGAMHDLEIFHDAITMSNTTHKSVPLILSPVASEAWDSIYHRKGLITAFNEAGYHTAYYSNQRRNHSFIDFFGCEAQDVVFTKDSVAMTENVSDDALKGLVRQRLERYDGGHLLLVLHCYGSHFNYKDRYPREKAYFKPDDVIAAEKSQRDKLVNAYDNTIRFDDDLIADIIEMLKGKQVPAFLVYTSDHGEDIYDDERNRFLHASPLPTYYQLRVPLFFWTSTQYRELYPDKCLTLHKNRDEAISTNMVIFHTLLDMSGIKANLMKPALALSNDAFTAPQRLFVTDHNEFVPLNKAGLKPLDEEQFKLHKLQYP